MESQQVLRKGRWWHQQQDGSWLVWNETTHQWGLAASPPPPPDRQSKGFREFRTHQIWATATLAIVIVVDAIAILFDLMEFSLLKRIERGTGFTLQEAMASDQRQRAMGILQLALYVTTGIAFIAWFHRSYRNVTALNPEAARYRTGWAIGGWFVPLLNLIRPKQIADDMWRGTTSLPEKVNPLLHWWWGLFLAQWLLGGVIANLSSSAETLEELTTSSSFLIAADVSSLAAGILAILVVVELSRRIRGSAAQTGVNSGWC